MEEEWDNIPQATINSLINLKTLSTLKTVKMFSPPHGKSGRIVGNLL
jgi:hypothetical protein